MTFKDLGLSEKLLQAIEDCGYTTPTPIQEQAIPHILMNRDVVGLAQTGTGKTASFTLPMIEILAGGRAKARMPRSLILSPTRELAAQIAENFDTYGKYYKLEKALLVGGVSMEDQIKKLDRGVDVLIATPGRLLDLFERGKILLTDIKILVIDEADRMLDMGFIPDIEKIVSRLSPMRQTLLFSATMPNEISKLTKKFLSNPREVSVAPPASTAEKVKQFLVWTSPKNKMQVLDNIIQQEDVKTAFIFCNRKRDIGALTKWLSNRKYAAKEMHGDMPQSSRMKTLEEFKNGEITLLVCSDVAGRGIDVDEISHVFNYDVPLNPDDYVHRIGRTGRAGHTGRAWTLATRGEIKQVDQVKKLIKIELEEPVIEGAEGKGADEGAQVASGRGDRDRKKQGERSGAGRTESSRSESSRSESGKPQAGRSVSERREKPLPKADNQNKNHQTSKPRDESRRPPRVRDENRDDGPSVVGFGDDVPSFFK